MLDPITKTDAGSSQDVLKSYYLTFRLDFLSSRFSSTETEEVVQLIKKKKISKKKAYKNADKCFEVKNKR